MKLTAKMYYWTGNAMCEAGTWLCLRGAKLLGRAMFRGYR